MKSASLIQLYREHQGKVSDKWSSYLVEYDRILSAYRSNALNLLEIGVQNGGSLEIWARYFKNARSILGCDINPDCSQLYFEDERIRVIAEDANSKAGRSAILNIAPTLDIVIDDGSHTSRDIIQSFTHYFPALAQGGIYIAEDLHCSYWENYEGGLFHPWSAMSFFKDLADVINHEHWGIEQRRSYPVRNKLRNTLSTLDESNLATIHSIEFVNSMCIVRKAAPRENLLGTRVVVGCDAIVDTAPQKELPDKSPGPEPQGDNFWSSLKLSPLEELEAKRIELVEKEREISNLSRQLSQYQSAIENIQQSHSWRLTSPLRSIWAGISGSFHMTENLRSAIRKEGGLLKSGHTLLSVIKSEGVQATWIRFSNTLRDRSGINYGKWIEEFDTLDDEQRNLIRIRISDMSTKPLISILMPTFNTPLHWLQEAINSVKNQLYENWELCIADDASTDDGLHELLEEAATSDPRIKVVFRKENGHISSASNSALRLCTGEWTALFDHDDLLPEHALFHVAEAINNHPGIQLIYSDEDKVGECGNRLDPYFKCSWNRDLFYSQNLISHLGVYKTSILNEIGGFRKGYEGSQDHDLALRYIERINPDSIHHIPRVLYHWRVHHESASHSSRAKPYATVAGTRALQSHFDRRGIDATVNWDDAGYRVKYGIAHPLPQVSILIPTRNAEQSLTRLLANVYSNTHYKNFEVIILDNGSDDPGTIDFYSNLERKGEVTVVREPTLMNNTTLINIGALKATGDFLCLLSDSAEVLSGNWLSELVSIAQQPGVGAVGPKLVKRDGTVLCCGLTLSGENVAYPAFHGLPHDHVGYFGRAELIGDWSAISSDCLVIKADAFQQVEGFSTRLSKLLLADVDFCLRLLDAGYRNVITPYSRVLLEKTRHFQDEESSQADPEYKREVKYVRKSWETLINEDPAYSPNLSQAPPDFSLAWPPRIHLP